MEVKSFNFEIKELADDGTFEGYAAVFGNVDKNGDVITAGAFTKTVAERPQVPILWCHEIMEQIGIGSLAEDSKGLLAKGKLTLEVQRAREVYALMQDGAALDLSIGYKAIKKTFEGGTRQLREVAVGEYSLLPRGFAANDQAQVTNVKAVKYMGLWDDETEQVGDLLQMLACGTSYAAAEDDPADVAAMQSILASLASLLAAELAEVGQEKRMAPLMAKAGRVLSGANADALRRVIGTLDLARKELQGVLDGGSSKADLERLRDSMLAYTGSGN